MTPMAKKRTDSKTPNRSPAWVVYARLDPELQAPVEEYINSHEYPPTLARVIERALRDLVAKHKRGRTGPAD